MKQLDIALIVNEVIAEVLKIELDKVNEEATLAELGADSLDMVEMNMLLEERVKNENSLKNIEIDDYSVNEKQTVAQLTGIVKELAEAE